MGTPPFVFANRVFGTHGVDAGKDITWKVYPAGELGLALDKGEIDAVADSEPIGSLLIAEGKVRNIADQIMDAPYNQEYCCEVIANGKWVDANPKAAAGSHARAVERREVGRNESESGRNSRGRKEVSRFHARAKHRRTRTVALHSERATGRGYRFTRPRANESRENAGARNRYRGIGQASVHAFGRRDR